MVCFVPTGHRAYKPHALSRLHHPIHRHPIMGFFTDWRLYCCCHPLLSIPKSGPDAFDEGFRSGGNRTDRSGIPLQPLRPQQQYTPPEPPTMRHSDPGPQTEYQRQGWDVYDMFAPAGANGGGGSGRQVRTALGAGGNGSQQQRAAAGDGQGALAQNRMSYPRAAPRLEGPEAGRPGMRSGLQGKGGWI